MQESEVNRTMHFSASDIRFVFLALSLLTVKIKYTLGLTRVFLHFHKHHLLSKSEFAFLFSHLCFLSFGKQKKKEYYFELNSQVWAKINLLLYFSVVLDKSGITICLN